jgi:SOS-response transcriptional repressor LexA
MKREQTLWTQAFRRVAVAAFSPNDVSSFKELAAKWGISKNMFNRLVHAYQLGYRDEIFARIDAGLGKRAGWTKTLYNICHMPDMSYERIRELLAADLEPVMSAATGAAGVPAPPPPRAPSGESAAPKTHIPVLRLTVTSPKPEKAGEDDITAWIPAPPTAGESQLVAFQIDDDAMAPRYLRGDYIIVDPAVQADPDEAKPAMIKQKNGPAVCRVLQQHGPALFLLPVNPSHAASRVGRREMQWTAKVRALYRVEG